MSDTTSIFYKIGQATKTAVDNAISALIAGNNTWTGTNDFKEDVTVGANGNAKALKVYGTAETTSDLTVGGNLTVNGTTTTLETTNTLIEDNIIRLAKGASNGAYTKDSGLFLERGLSEQPKAFVYDASEGEFLVGEAVAGTFEITNYRIDTATGYATLFFEMSGNVIPHFEKIGFVKFSQASSVGIQTPSASNTAGFYMVTDQSHANFGTMYLVYDDTSGTGTTLDFYESETTYYDHNQTQQTFGNEVVIDMTGSHGTSGILMRATSASLINPTAITVVPTDSGEDAELDNLNPIGLRVGSLKIEAQALGNLADFNAGLSA